LIKDRVLLEVSFVSSDRDYAFSQEGFHQRRFMTIAF
jgi:hypothetical protein